MEIFNNTTKVVKDDLVKTIKRGDRIAIAAACDTGRDTQTGKADTKDRKRNVEERAAQEKMRAAYTAA